MHGHFPIGVLATLFGVVTLLAALAVLYRLRRVPVMAMIAAHDRRIAFHRDALRALDSAVAAARAEGRASEAERLAPHRAIHIRALAHIAAGEPFAGERGQ